MQGHQEALEVWGGRLRELATMKTDASQYVLPGDTALLQAQLDQLSGHWEELCLKVRDSEGLREREREREGERVGLTGQRERGREIEGEV